MDKYKNRIENITYPGFIFLKYHVHIAKKIKENFRKKPP